MPSKSDHSLSPLLLQALVFHRKLAEMQVNFLLGGIKHVANTCKPVIRINRNNFNAIVVSSVAYNFLFGVL